MNPGESCVLARRMRSSACAAATTTCNLLCQIPGRRSNSGCARQPLVALATQYNVALSVIQDGGATVPVTVLKGLRPAPDQYISVFADSALLKPGRYQLVVRLDGSASPDAEEIFLIRVRPPGSAGPDAT